MKKKHMIKLTETLHDLSTRMTDLHKIISEQRQDNIRLWNALFSPSDQAKSKNLPSGFHIEEKNLPSGFHIEEKKS